MSIITNATLWCDAKGCHNHFISSWADPQSARKEAKKTASWSFRLFKFGEARGERMMRDLCPSHAQATLEEVREE